MRLLALARKPTDLDAACKSIAELLGITPAEARMRLMPEPPCLFGRLEASAAGAVESKLSAAGLAVVGVEEPVPTDSDRLMAGRIAFAAAEVTISTRDGRVTETIPHQAISLLLRGVRARTTESVKTETSKSFSLGLAVATGGMMMTRTQKRDVRSTNEESEQLILLHAPGHATVLFTDSAFNFSSLGAACKPTKMENILYLTTELKKRASAARFDDRMLRLGRRPLPFVLSSGQSSRASVDVLDALLWEAHQRGLLGD